jgi:hypothetical protein
MEEAEENRVSMAEHLTEFFRLVLWTTLGTIVFAVLAGINRAELQRELADILWQTFRLRLSDQRHLTTSVWSALISVPTFQILATYNAVRFIAPGLYSDEKVILRFVTTWIFAAPSLALALGVLTQVLPARLNGAVPEYFAQLSITTVRFDLLTILIAVNLTLPRIRLKPKLLHSALASILIFAMPSAIVEVFATSLVLFCGCATTVAFFVRKRLSKASTS